MKKTTRILSLVLAVMLMMSLAITASADSITIKDPPANATYAGYQLLTLSAALKVEGCHATETEHTANCYNFAYDVNAKYADILEEVTGKTTGNEIVAYIGAMASDSDEIRTFADTVFAKIKEAALAADMTSTTGVFADSKQGYWLIEETNKGDATDYSLVMLTTMGIRDITVNTKRDNVVLKKKVYHDDTASWEIVGDNQIGDTVNFHTESYVPDADGFDELYVYVIHDTFSEGLTSNVVTGNTNGDVSVTINNPSNVTGAIVLDSKYYSVYDSTYTGEIKLGEYTDEHGVKQTKNLNCTKGCDFHIVFDIRAALADKVVDDDDVLYANYSAVLNEDAKVYQTAAERENNKAHVEYSNNPYDENETYSTPDVPVYEYTFKLDVLKTDKTTGKEIQGAKFVMSKKSDLDTDVIDPEKDGIANVTTDLMQFIYNKTDDTYTVKPASFTDADLATNESLTYVINAGSPVIKGLNDATDYYLYEIKAPDGYNPKAEATRIKIFATYNKDTGDLVTVKVQVDSKEQSESMKVTIENSTGTVLPSTGGMGTTLFYVFGGILFVGAAVLLVTKKRMAQ